MSRQLEWWERPLVGKMETLPVPNAANFPFASLTLPNLLPWAVQTLAQADIERAEFEMQLLLAQSLDVSRVAVITGSYSPPDATQLRDFVRLIWARARHVPLAYLRGDQEFYALPFRVTPAVLIPRPETEMLVDAALQACNEAASALASPPMVADVGTGSGCIPISLLANCPTARAVGYDISRQASALARANAVANGVADRFRAVCGNGLAASERGRYHVIVSNPPYIPTPVIGTLEPEVRDYEPFLALNGGPDGLAFYPGLASEAYRALRPGGRLFVEVGQGQARAVAEILRKSGLHDVRITSDLAGIERMVEGTRQ